MKSVSKKYNLDSFNSGHFFEDLSEHETFYFKRFFRGLSIYIHDRLVACLCDGAGDKSFRGKKYKIDIWNGCLIPTNRENHAAILKLIKGSVVHPVIEKWMYLPQKSEHFEDSMVQLVQLIKTKNPLIGIAPDLKVKKEKIKIKV